MTEDKSYDNFNKEVEDAVDQRLEGFTKNIQKQMQDQMSKDYTNTWLKASPLMLGGGQAGDLTQPASQSYLVYKCITVIANNFPQAPFIILDQNNDPVPDNNPLKMLLQNPNEFMSGFDLWSATSTFYTLYGEAYWYLVQSVGQSIGTSRLPAEIILLDPRKIKEVVDPDSGYLKGWLYDGRISLEIDEVLQFKNTNPYNRWRGLSPLDAVAIEIRSDYKASQYQGKFFDNNAIPGMVLKVDKDDQSTLPELKKLVRLWEQGHKGVNKAHKTGILRGGMSFETVGLNQQEMDFINSRAFTRDIVLSVFGVPKVLAGFTENINRATAETQKRSFWEETLKPQMMRMQERLNARLVSTAFPELHGVFDFSKIDELKKGMEDDVKNAAVLFSMGFSRNELNRRFDLGFEEELSGDSQYVPMNLIDINAEPLEIAPEPDKQLELKPVVKDEKSARATRQRQIFLRKQQKNERMLLGKFRKFFITQRTKILKHLFNKEISTSELVSRVNIIEAEDLRLIATITPAFQTIMQDSGDMALSFINSEAEYQIDKGVLFDRVNKVKGINQTVFKQIKTEIAAGVDAGEDINTISTRIKKIYKFADKRSVTIARTESSTLMNETTLKVYSTNGVAKKSWITSGDEGVGENCKASAAQGPIPVNKNFVTGLMFPQEMNCRCCIVPVVSL